jgi:hypothetical protein
MLQGRRPHQNKFSPPSRPKAVKRRVPVRIINSRLQWRYTLILGFTSTFLVACFAGPAWYFLRDNYQVFQRIAYDTHPGLISHLEREQVWIGLLLLLGTLATGLITAWTTLRITTLWLGPLSNMERHMRRLIRGDWSGHEFIVRETDEMREFTGTYSYLYRTLRAQAEAEIKLLEKIRVDETQVESLLALENLRALKRGQLGLNPDVSSEVSVSAPSQRRAS